MNVFNILYDPNNGEDNYYITDPISIKDKIVILHNNAPELNFAYSGKRFKGWSFDRNAENPVFYGGEYLDYSSADEGVIILYACWV